MQATDTSPTLSLFNIPAAEPGVFNEGSAALAWIFGASVYPLYRKIRVTKRNKWIFLFAGIALFAACMFYITKLTGGLYSGKAIYSVYSYMMTALFFLCFLLFGKGGSRSGAARKGMKALAAVMKFFSGYMYSLFITHYSLWYLLYAFPPYAELVKSFTTAQKLMLAFVIAHAFALLIGLAFERNGSRLAGYIKSKRRRKR
jgi:hypothetical protein